MTESREDYLKAIFKLAEQEGEVSNKTLSNYLHIAPASVSEMLKKLEAEGYVDLQGRDICLTKTGASIAKNILTKHRLWETFLLRHLDYNWSEVHEIAEHLEHITDEMLKDRLNNFLAYPTHCPHGAVIYENVDHPMNVKKSPLSHCEVGSHGKIVKVDDQRHLLAYLDRIHVELGMEFTVLGFDEFDGAIHLRLANNEEVAISSKALRNIYVKLSS